MQKTIMANYTGNYINASSISDEFYKVSFITTHSEKIPSKLKQTGSLIVMDNVNSKRKSLWFRGDLVASGYGFINQQEAELSTYFINNVNKIFGDEDGYNGIYDFIPGYQGIGKSLNERFRDIDYEFKENWSYTFNAYAYCLDCLERSYEYIYETRTYSYENIAYLNEFLNLEIPNIWAFTRSAYAYTLGYIADSNSYIFEALDATYSYTLDYIADSYNRGYETDLAVHAYVGTMSDLLHKYVDASITKLVGHAPEDRDTLGEIVYLLERAKDAGFNMWKDLYEIQNHCVTHYNDSPSLTGYSYIKEYAYSWKKSEPQEGWVWSEEGPEGDEDMEVWISQDFGSETYWYKQSYTYYTYSLEKSSFLAMNANQICTTKTFNNYQLDYLLTKIVPPYPYEIPTVELDRYQERELNETYYEYGEVYNFDSIKIKYNAKDASNNTYLKYANELEEREIETEIENHYDNMDYYPESNTRYYQNDKEVSLNIGRILIDTYPIKRLNKHNNDDNIVKLNVKYDKSFERKYPSLRELDITDVDHMIPAGNYYKNIFENVRLQARYRVYWWYGNETESKIEDIPNNRLSSALLTEKYFRTKPMEIKDSTMNSIFIAIPNNDNFITKFLQGIKIENFDTGICKEIFNTKTRSDLFEIESQDYPLKKAVKYNDDESYSFEISYKIFRYTSKVNVIGDIFRIILDFSRLY